jgi:hypothetical protein
MSYYAVAQTPVVTEKNGRESYIYWGYHRNFYAPSDIHFKSDRYDFTLLDAKANDMPANKDQYFKLKEFSVPQFNFRMGTELKNNWFLSLGYDHHKYRLTQTQNMKIEGNIDPSALAYYKPDPADGGTYVGSFSSGDTILYKRSFMDFHHSNGMNYIRVQLEKRGTIFQFPKIKSRIDLYGGLGTGAVICWTDFTFMRQRYLNNLHFSGIGISAVYGARFVINDCFFIQHGFQNGINYLFDIQLEKHAVANGTNDGGARASQTIHYFERGVQVGYTFKIGQKKNKKLHSTITPSF